MSITPFRRLKPAARAARVLVAEDSHLDIFLLRLALSATAPGCHVDLVTNGMEALDYLFRRGRFSDVVAPDLVLLDLNLPMADGYEVLREVKSSRELKNIPIVILTTSADPSHVEHCARLQANDYFTKPVSPFEFDGTLRQIIRKWLQTDTLPDGPESNVSFELVRRLG